MLTKFQETLRWLVMLAGLLAITRALQPRHDWKVLPKELMEEEEGHLLPAPDQPRSRHYRHVLQQTREEQEDYKEEKLSDNELSPIQADTLLLGDRHAELKGRNKRSPGRISTVLSTRLQRPQAKDYAGSRGSAPYIQPKHKPVTPKKARDKGELTKKTINKENKEKLLTKRTVN